MGLYKYPKQVKLIIGLLAKNQESLNTIKSTLIKELGEFDQQMENIPFEWTNYYKEEVGETPIRTFLSFKALIDREVIVDIKRLTNEIELTEFNGIRMVNIDPGYMTLGQFFLATTKDQRQRVYISKGIFIDPTLYYKEKQYKWYDWTYHDYRSKEYHDFLKSVRKIYHNQLKQ